MYPKSRTMRSQQDSTWVGPILMTAHGDDGNIIIYQESANRCPEAYGYFFESSYWKTVDVYGFFSIHEMMESLESALARGWVVDDMDLEKIFELIPYHSWAAAMEDKVYELMKKYPEQFQLH